MAQIYISELDNEVILLSGYYMKNIINITVEDVCNHSINRNLSKQMTIDLISYLYGLHKNIAINNNDPYSRHNCFIGMGEFYNALNLLENNYNIQLYSLSNRYIENPSVNNNQNIECLQRQKNVAIIIPSPQLKLNIEPIYSDFKFDKIIPGVHSMCFNNNIEPYNDIQYYNFDFCY
jgi:hypothetical protein